MNIKPIFYGTALNGKLKIEDKEGFNTYLASLNGDVQILVEKRRKQRSLNQNNYYWGVVIPMLADQFGYESEEMHEALKYMFLKKGKVELPTVRSTSSLTTVEFEDYMTRVRRWALQEQQILIPEPNEPDFFMNIDDGA